MKTSILTVLTSLMLSVPLSAQTLSPTDCEMISKYNDLNAGGFVEHLLDYALQAELCILPEVEFGCRGNLKRRVSAIQVGDTERGEVTVPYFQSIFDQVAENTLNKLEVASGIDVKFRKSEYTKGDSIIFFTYIDQSSLLKKGESYFEDVINGTIVFPSGSLSIIFSDFLKNDKIPCQTGSSIRETGEISSSVIWIKTNIAPTVIQKCVTEELLEAFGLSEGIQTDSIFDNAFGREESGNLISNFDLMMIHILYSIELTLGMEEIEMRHAVEENIRRSCVTTK